MADPYQPSPSSQSVSRARPEGKRTIEQGVEYLKLVRDTFGSRNDSRYRGFLRVMKDYKGGIFDTLEVISLVKEMFEGHHELLTGFNILLPRGYSINSVAPTKDPPTALEARVEAVNLVNKIRTRLQDDKLYRSLVDVMCKYGRNPRVNILFKELPILFQDHPDLLAELYIRYPETKGQVPERCTEGSET